MAKKLKISKEDVQDILALSPLQEGMLYHYLKRPESDQYFVQLCLNLTGSINNDIFKKAWNYVVQTNEMLRTVFMWETFKNPIQVVLKKRDVEIQEYDFSDIENIAARTKRLNQVKEKDKNNKFQLESGSLFRIILCKLSQNNYEMIISYHHIVYDGWSNGIVLKEFFAVYDQFAKGQTSLKITKNSYKEFLKWVHNQNQNQQAQYWREYLQDFDSKTELPTYLKKESEIIIAENYLLNFPHDLTMRLKEFVKQQKITLSALFYASWAIFLERFNNKEDVVFGVTVSGRPTDVEKIEEMVGLFINTLPLRAKPNGSLILENFLQDISKALKEQQNYQCTPLVEIKSYSEIDAQSALFDSILVVENYPLDQKVNSKESALTLKSYSISEMTNFDLTVAINVFEKIEVNFSYNRDLFTKEMIGNYANYFVNILSEIIENPKLQISQIKMISKEEENLLLSGFNNTSVEYDQTKTIQQWFEEQVEKTPENIAVIFDEKELTYRELNKKANQLARVLRKKGVQRDDLVAIIAERSLEMIIGIIGILKAGGAYLPIAAEYPEKRIAYMLEDSKTKIVLTQKNLIKKLDFRGEIICLNDVQTSDDNNLEIINYSKDLAYEIYTSGSTGKPKGVLIEHKSILNYIHWRKHAYNYTSEDITLQLISFSFDGFGSNLYSSLLSGGTFILPKDNLDYYAIKDLIREKKITNMSIVPSMYQSILEVADSTDLSSLRFIVLAGEAAKKDLLELSEEKKLNIQFCNEYGPTENSVTTTSLLNMDVSNISLIGKPIYNNRVYILNKYNNLLPLTAAGELCISGVGLARGYHNNSELTEEKFVKNPFVDNPFGIILEERMYRTGDLAQWCADGNIKFLGRIDHQVKIRGYRIELGEIENQLVEHEEIEKVVVIDREDINHDKYLCAYFVSENDVKVNNLREYLGKVLPDYMVPKYFVKLDQILLTTNGKINKKSLPIPDIAIGGLNEYIEPSNEIEEKLVDIWKEILGVNSVGINDNFFELGGHSLKVTSFVSRVYKEFDIKIPLQLVFDSPTIKKLAEYISNAKKSLYKAIQPVEEREYYLVMNYPTSSAQKRLLILNQLDDNSTNYNTPGAMLIKGNLNLERFENTFKALIKRHESLRTSFEYVNAEAVQRIHKDVDIAFKIDYFKAKEADIEKCIEKFVKPFDLRKAPLLRVALVKLENQHLLLFDMHHIISDGTSMGVFVRDFVDLYRGKSLDELRIQYKDFAIWQNELLQSDQIKEQEKYWLECFDFGNEISQSNLPTDYLRPLLRNFEGEVLHFRIGKERKEKLDQMVSDQGVTLYMTLLAFFNIMLSNFNTTNRILVGTPITGREYPDLESIIGMFVNTLVMKNEPSGSKTFREFLVEVKENALKAYANQDYQFEMLVDKLDLARDMSKNPLFDTMFILQNTHLSEIQLEDLTFTPYEIKNKISKFDLSLNAVEVEDDILFDFEFCTKLFKRETIERLANYYKNIWDVVLENPEVKISEIEMISENEKYKLLYQFNDTTMEESKVKLLHQLFEEQVDKTPANIAVTFADTQMTYRELNQRANQLARLLIEKGIQKDDIVGLLIERSIEMIVGIMGVLKAGGAYLPIDPTYPEDRIQYMLNDSNVQIVLTQSHFEDERMYSNDSSNLENVVKPDDLAYVIYTSGSTGKPKGVMIEHLNVVNTIYWRKNEYYLNADDRVLQLFSYSFDGFVTSFFTPIVSGAEVILLNEDDAKDVLAIKEVIVTKKVTHFIAVPSLYSAILECILAKEAKSLRIITLAGEKVPKKLIVESRKLNPDLELVNEYGPTENSVATTILRNMQLEEKVTIGSPVANTRVYILNSYQKLLPINVPGEICISGGGLSRGYLNRADLTKEKFIDHPFIPGERIYKTGDLARWLPNGKIEFLGRIDHQVKIRGFRIEIEEIEAQLLKHKDVQEVIVIDKEDDQNNQYLAAYIVAGCEIGVDELREFLAHSLPNYMIPTYFTQLEKMPLTPNGKIDRKALPEPTQSCEREYVAPENDVEEKLAVIWSDVLGVQKVGVYDNFFDLGGHSLKATFLIAKVYKFFGVELSLKEIFKTTILREQALLITNTEKKKYLSIDKLAENDSYPPGCYPVSSAQMRLYILDQLDEDSTTYNMPGAFRIEGNLNQESLENVFKELINRHESLRTSFVTIDGEVYQKVHQDVDFNICYLKASENKLEELIEDFIKPFDLSKAPLLRVGVLKSGDQQILIIDLHHIISDGFSMGIIFKEFSHLYENLKLPELKIQYKDFAVWQNRFLLSDEMIKQQTYWLERFNEEIPLLSLPTDFVRPPIKSFIGDRIIFEADNNLRKQLKKLESSNQTTLYIVLLASYSILLSKYAGQNEVILGSPLAGRQHVDLENVVGMFVNTLAMRNKITGDQTFIEFLEQVKEDTFKAFENQDYQFEMLVDQLNLSKNMSRTPVFDVMFALQNGTDVELQMQDFKLVPYDFDFKVAKFDLTLNALEIDGKIRFDLEYCTKLFKRVTIEQMAEHFLKILREVTVNPEQKISEIELLLEDEKQKLLCEFNKTEVSYPEEKTICQFFEEQVEKNPDNIAVKFEDKHLTYRELNAKANQLARKLRNKGVSQNKVVGIQANRSLKMLVGVLAIVKAGGCYLPIDVDYPESRVKFMIEDSNVHILVIEKEIMESLSFAKEIINLGDEGLYSGDDSNLELINQPNDLIYIIYTSGSTGQPKGVMIEHKNVNRLISNSNMLIINEDERIMQTGSLAFDASTFEIWGSLLNGATLYLISKDDQLSADKFGKKLKDNQISMIWLTAPFFNQLVEEDLSIFSELKTLIVGGDALSVKHINLVRTKYPNLTIINGYGPTESTTFTTYFKIDKEYQENIPLGYPVSNTQVYILDENNQLQPVGVPGELVISGDGLARGYLNRPELTKEKFVQNPFVPGERMYKTGDLARWRRDGKLEFLGRIDHQVKIRGFRIEIGEIETYLLRHSEIKETVVVVKVDDNDNKYLVAYFVSDREISVSEIRTYMKEELPNYMIPSHFVQLEKLPLTSNGKVNRKVLPDVDGNIKVGTDYVAPTNEIEIKLAEIWSDILNIDRIGVNDNFFELGGHSLKATTLSSRISKEFKVAITLQRIFKEPTIRELAAYILEEEKSIYKRIEPIEEREYYPISSAQKRMFVINQFENQTTGYNIPGMMFIEGKFNRDRFEEAFSKVIERHESLRTSFESLNGEIVQIVHQDVDFEITYLTANENELEKIAFDFIKPFDLTQAPLIRVGVLTIKECHLLMIDMHHIISDGTSMGVLSKDFIKFYNGIEVPKLRVQYKDFANWQNEFFIEHIQKQEEYWLERLTEISVLDLPTDNQRPAEMSYEGERINFTLNDELTKQLKELAKRTGATLYMVLLAIYNVFLHKYTAQEDIIIGSPIAGRNHADLEDMIGMFVNTLALRNYPIKDKVFKEFLVEVKADTLETFENQDYPFEMLVDKLDLERDLSRNPIFDTLFVMQNINQIEAEIGDLRLIPFEFDNKISKFDLSLNVSERDKELEMGFEYRTKLFKEETIKRMAGHLINIIKQVVSNPEITLKEIEIISQEEKEEILTHFIGKNIDYPKDKTISELFEMQVERSKDQIAVVYEDQRLTYRELNEKSNQLARVLREKGVTKDQIVAIMSERSLEMIIGVMAIVKAGGAYLPIDLDYPEERVSYMLKDTDAKILLTQSDLIGQSYITDEQIDLSDQNLYTGECSNLEQINQSNDLIYIIYTSGSTGNPKGVMIKHINVNRLISNSNMLQINQNDRILQTGSLAFDASTFEIWGALLNGAGLYLTKKENILSPERFEVKMKEYQITKIWLTAPLFNQLLESNPAIFDELETLYVGGDALSPKHINDVRKMHKNLRVVNGYGPTESTTFTTFFNIDKEYTNIPIGIPVSNTKVYILDSSNKVQPIGVPGELCITGDGLARGYLNQPELTKEKFVENPLTSELMYRTGDLVRWLPNRNIEFIGRIDQQVKIRGFRIELGEIENYLLTHEMIKDTIVIDRKDTNDNKYLCAYFVAEVELSVGELRSYLKKELPDYMIPSYFVQLEKLPLTSNGKVNRRALPEPEGNLITDVYVAPRNEVEETLAEIFSKVLGVKQVGIDDNYFDLGGDSIKAIKIVADANQANLNISVKDLFKYKTISELLDNVDYAKKSKEISQEEVEGEVLLTPIQQWFFDKKLSHPHYWNQNNLFKLRDDVNLELLEKVFKKIIEHHDALRMGYKFAEDKVLQINRRNDEIDFKLQMVDLSDECYQIQSEQIKNISEEIQAKLNLETDFLIQGVIFDLGENGKRLFISIHHLVIDGVSWRILLEDIEFLYNSNLEMELPLKTTSYKDWSRKLVEFAEREVLNIDYWEQIDHTNIPSLSITKVEENRLKDHDRKLFELDKDRTDELLTKINWAYNTEINDILLTALTLALSESTNTEHVFILLEGHGREEMIEDVVITRTIGWFTSIYPICLKKEDTLEKTIVEVKDQLHRLPNKGLSFGVARYLQRNTRLQTLNPEISFNYLGQMDGIVSMDTEQSEDVGLLSIAGEEACSCIQGDNLHATLLDITGMVVNGKLQMGFNYNHRYITEEWMDEFVSNYQENLIEVIEHCLRKDEQRFTVSDLDMEDIWDDEDLEMISDLYDL
ncbi:MAG: amino acid adenylation domain-containing protein [Halanaerobiales bacterium]|nr:amino acid adenylation domain-containing protein [Halanaerobiales bacterium]